MVLGQGQGHQWAACRRGPAWASMQAWQHGSMGMHGPACRRRSSRPLTAAHDQVYEHQGEGQVQSLHMETHNQQLRMGSSARSCQHMGDRDSSGGVGHHRYLATTDTGHPGHHCTGQPRNLPPTGCYLVDPGATPGFKHPPGPGRASRPPPQAARHRSWAMTRPHSAAASVGACHPPAS